jgi:hypothetical protein
MKNEQIISLAEVRDTFDPWGTGSFLARIDYLNNEEVRVNYVTPYASNGEGAFIAIPEEGTEILVCRPVGSQAWYYMGSTLSPEENKAEGAKLSDASVPPLDRVDPNISRARGVPMKIALKSNDGAGLTISEEYNPEFINKKVELNSTVGKKVTLNDSPAVDSLILDSGNGSKITISNDPKNDHLPSRAIQIESVGPQKFINSGSQTDVVVGADGRELQLLNGANGVQWGDGAECGNVNIQSKWRDINVYSCAEKGKIFIQCLNQDGSDQVIQIETKGTGGGIIIKTRGDISLNAEGNLNLNAGEGINMKAGSKVSIDCATLDVRSTGVANIDGSVIHLAGDQSTPTPPDTPSVESTYGGEGITTY